MEQRNTVTQLPAAHVPVMDSRAVVSDALLDLISVLELTSESLLSPSDRSSIGEGKQEDSGAGCARDRDNVIFVPSQLSLLLLNQAMGGSPMPSSTCRIDRTFKVVAQGLCTAVLICQLPEDDEYDEEDGDIELEGETRLILDLQATLCVNEELDQSTGNRISCAFSYSRLGHEVTFEIFTTDVTGDAQLRAIDFLFGQYTFYSNMKSSAYGVGVNDGDDAAKPNMFARGLEGTGSVLRTALRSGGKATGSAIRYLGKKYTEAAVDTSKVPVERNVENHQLEEAAKMRDRCEGVHAGMPTRLCPSPRSQPMHLFPPYFPLFIVTTCQSFYLYTMYGQVRERSQAHYFIPLDGPERRPARGQKVVMTEVVAS